MDHAMWDWEFLEALDRETLFEATEAANFLGIKSFRDLPECRFIAKIMIQRFVTLSTLILIICGISMIYRVGVASVA